MKRLTILMLILAGFTVLCPIRNSIINSDTTQMREISNGVCFGQRSSRSLPRKIFQLVEPRLTGPMSLEEALAKQQIVRHFTSQKLKNADAGQLAWAGMKVTEQQTALPTADSAEATSPIELYFATQNGVFVYRPEQHSLEQVDQQDIRNALTNAASMQQATLEAPCDIIVTGSAKKLSGQFQNDARKHMFLQAGHVAQNIQLQAVCLGLGSVTTGGFNVRDVSRACKLPRGLEPVYIISIGYPTTQPATPATPEQTSTTEKRAVLIAASQAFNIDELFQTIRILEENGIRTTIASTRTGIITSAGNTAESRVSLEQLRVDDYDAVIFIGGPGALIELINNVTAINIAREAVVKRKVLAAIDNGPSILANAGVLTDVRATGLVTEQTRLVQAGAVYTGTPVERSGLIITASSSLAVVTFSQAIVNTLTGK